MIYCVYTSFSSFLFVVEAMNVHIFVCATQFHIKTIKITTKYLSHKPFHESEKLQPPTFRNVCQNNDQKHTLTKLTKLGMFAQRLVLLPVARDGIALPFTKRLQSKKEGY